MRVGSALHPERGLLNPHLSPSTSEMIVRAAPIRGLKPRGDLAVMTPIVFRLSITAGFQQPG